MTTSNHPSDLESRPEYSGADRSDCSESNRGSNAAHGPRSQRIEIIETFDSLQNPRGANVAIIPPRTTLGLPQRTPSLPSATSGSYDNAYVQRAVSQGVIVTLPELKIMTLISSDPCGSEDGR